MTEFLPLTSHNLTIVIGMMLVMWLLSLICQDASIVDPFWGFGFVVIAWNSWWQIADHGGRTWLLLVLVTIWGLRLSGYLVVRNGGHGEDRRYASMRAHHGDRFWWISLFTVFLLQGVVMWFVSLVVQNGMLQTRGLWWLDGVGVLLWLVGVFFETVGDLQMARFRSRSENAGQVMDTGLWGYTRHPNYFGDFCVWWGLYLVAAAGGGWWTIMCPLLMSYLLLKVSGVSLLEQDITDRRPAYREYQRRTNAFFPGPRRVD